MKIKLEEPFKSLWRLGYLRESKTDGRRRIDLVNSNKNRTTISYARYLKSVELGYMIEDTYEVDHINANRKDDSIVNLQLLTKEQHREKTGKEFTGRSMIELQCAYCNSIFSRFANQDHRKHGTKNSFCSRRCNGKYQRQKQLTKEKI